MTVFNFLRCLFGLFRNRSNAYNLKFLLGLNITSAKIITSGFRGFFSKTIFRLLQSDSTRYKRPSPKKRRKHSVDSCTPHSQTELNLLHRDFEKFYEKLSYPVHNNSNKHRASTLPISIYECYELRVESNKKPD